MTKPNDTSDALNALLGLDGALPGARPDLAREIDQMADLFAPLLRTLPEADPPDDLLEAIEAEIDGLPNAPTQSVRAEDGAWEQRTDKVWKKVLAEDPDTGRSMYLLRCLPGAVIRPHLHERAEHLYILEGELWIGNTLFSAGDAQASLPGTEHAEIRMPAGCLVLVSA